MEAKLSRRSSAPAWSTYERKDMAVPSWLEFWRPEENISSWATLMTAMIFWRLQSSWRNCVKDSTSSKGAGYLPVAVS